jgi:hypothetical protein
VKRLPLIAFQVVLVALLAFGAAELWSARHPGEKAPPSDIDTMSVGASVRPSVHTFGQPIVATVQVVADASLVKPQTIRVETDFSPYELAGAASVERKVANGIARVVFRYPLRCLTEGCDASGDRGVAQFESGFVHYRFVRGSGPGRNLIDWPAIHVASRVTETELDGIDWRASRTALPTVTTRFDSGTLALVLVAIAIVLAGIAAWLALRLWRIEPAPEPASVDARTSLERALDLVVSIAANGAPMTERRRSLERLARELDANGYIALAENARELAWSSSSASSEDIAALVQHTSETAGRGSAA